MYVLTNIEAEVTHKVLKSLTGPEIDNSLPEDERKTLRDLIEKLGTSIDNGLPTDPILVDNTLPTPPPTPGNELPTSPTPDTPDNALPGKPAGRPDNETPGAKPK
jgi:hypothetical protein